MSAFSYLCCSFVVYFVIGSHEHIKPLICTDVWLVTNVQVAAFLSVHSATYFSAKTTSLNIRLVASAWKPSLSNVMYIQLLSTHIRNEKHVNS